MNTLNQSSQQDGSDMEFQIRSPLIKGLTDTVKDSAEFNSNAQIDSVNLANGKKQKKDKNVKRESIYKQALLKQLEAQNKFPKMNIDSFNSADSGDENNSASDSEESQDMPKVSEETRLRHRKSRFGQAS